MDNPLGQRPDDDSASLLCASLLQYYEQIVAEFPPCLKRREAELYARSLRKMISEDDKRAGKALSMASMSMDEKVSEYIFRLRDLNGRGGGYPLTSHIFSSDGGTSPADELTKLGVLAVPALIEAMADRRPTRVVSYRRHNFKYGHEVLTIGDCAETILEKISGLTLDGSVSASEKISEEEEVAIKQRRAWQWWEERLRRAGS